jgi:peptidoglycan/LPS O-acetylase OafA/YrhL
VAERRNNFDLLRLVAAATVIFSHAFLIAEGTNDREPLVVLSGRQCPLGLVGVFVFFTMSGFLVTQSWESTGSPLRYLAKRALRIFPGLFAALCVSAFMIAPLVTSLAAADYLGRPDPYAYVVANTLLDFSRHQLPGVLFADNAVGLEINGSLWTLRYEFMMYLMVLAVGLLGAAAPLATLVLLLLGLACLSFESFAVFGTWGWLLAFFAAGMLLYRLRDSGIFRARWALLALAGLLATLRFGQFIQLFPLLGGYLAIFLALDRRLPHVPAARFGDLSYGLYIYGWPAEQLVAWASGGRAPWWEVFLLGLALALGLAWLSWHLVEAPMLRLKPAGAGGRAAEPAAPPIRMQGGRPVAASLAARRAPAALPRIGS